MKMIGVWLKVILRRPLSRSVRCSGVTNTHSSFVELPCAVNMASMSPSTILSSAHCSFLLYSARTTRSVRVHSSATKVSLSLRRANTVPSLPSQKSFFPFENSRSRISDNMIDPLHNFPTHILAHEFYFRNVLAIPLPPRKYLVLKSA
jgi:hypothetical protein